MAAKKKGRPPKSGPTRTRTTVSLDAELLEKAREQVAIGRAVSISALIEQALEKELRTGELEDLLDELDEIYGPPSQAAKEWVAEVMASLGSS